MMLLFWKVSTFFTLIHCCESAQLMLVKKEKEKVNKTPDHRLTQKGAIFQERMEALEFFPCYIFGQC